MFTICSDPDFQEGQDPQSRSPRARQRQLEGGLIRAQQLILFACIAPAPSKLSFNQGIDTFLKPFLVVTLLDFEHFIRLHFPTSGGLSLLFTTASSVNLRTRNGMQAGIPELVVSFFLRCSDALHFCIHFWHALINMSGGCHGTPAFILSHSVGISRSRRVGTRAEVKFSLLLVSR